MTSLSMTGVATGTVAAAASWLQPDGRWRESAPSPPPLILSSLRPAVMAGAALLLWSTAAWCCEARIEPVAVVGPVVALGARTALEAYLQRRAVNASLAR